ncbi:MAG: aldo/keto reductase [Thermoguttaceae bacterium]
MEYRRIGQTEMQASIIGLGTEHLDNKPFETVEEVIDVALEQQINFFDVFMPGTPVREHIGKALKGQREKVIIQGHIGSVDLREQYDISRDVAICRKYFEELLRCLKTDYIDLGMMFFIDSEKDYKEVFETDYIDYVLQLKKGGKIRAIGFSSHNPETAARVVQTGLIEHLMFSINLAYDMLPVHVSIIDTLMSSEKINHDLFQGIDPVRGRLYELCASRGVSISVMKTLGAGKLISPEHTPFAKPLTVGQCIHYALTRPGVISTLIGARNRAEVLEAVQYLRLTEEERDYSPVMSSFREFQRKCVYCNHCRPCPVDIDIATVTKYMEIAAIEPTNIPPGVVAHYQSLEHKASECIQCGSCENRCPFGVPIIENMTQTVQLFGS